MHWYHWLISYALGAAITSFYVTLSGMMDDLMSDRDMAPLGLFAVAFWPITVVAHTFYFPFYVFPHWLRDKLQEMKKEREEKKKERRAVPYNKQLRFYASDADYRTNALPVAVIATPTDAAVVAGKTVQLVVDGKVVGELKR